MKPRRLAPGERNIVGARVTEARLAADMKQVELLARLQTRGVEISVPPCPFWRGRNARYPMSN